MGASNQFIALCYALPNVEYDIEDEFASIVRAWDSVKRNMSLDSLLHLAYSAVWALSRRTGREIHHITEDMIDLHTRKNAGYAGLSTDPWKNFRECQAFGVTAFTGCLVRLSDKYQRYCNLARDGTLDRVNEPITDTLMDIACYSLIAICLYEEPKEHKRNTAHAD